MFEERIGNRFKQHSLRAWSLLYIFPFGDFPFPYRSLLCRKLRRHDTDTANFAATIGMG